MRPLTAGYVTATAVLGATALGMLVFYAPVDQAMGPMQKIVYLHAPAAINAFLACFVVFLAGIGYLWQRRLWWDDLAEAAGIVAVLACAFVLVTGMIWARSEWGTWWTWSPQLTFSLALFVLYVVYVGLRMLIHAPPRRAVICAVYGVAAFLDVPLFYLSARLIPDIHPSAIALGAQMRLTLTVWIVSVTMLAAGLVAALHRHSGTRRTRATARRSADHHAIDRHATKPRLSA